jgi:hypothetical protein
LRLLQKDQDIAAKSDITLGGASIDSRGNWPGRWEELPATSAGRITVQIPAASATILKFGPGG